MPDPNNHNQTPGNPGATWDMSDAPAYQGSSETNNFIEGINQAHSEAKAAAKEQLDSEMAAAEQDRHANYEALREQFDTAAEELKDRVAALEEQLKQAKQGRRAEVQAIHERAQAELSRLEEVFNTGMESARTEHSAAIDLANSTALDRLTELTGEVEAAEASDAETAEAKEQDNQALEASLTASIREQLSGRGYTEEELTQIVDAKVAEIIDSMRDVDADKALSAAEARAQEKAKIEKAKAEILNPKKTPIRSFLRKFWGGKAPEASADEPPVDDTEARISEIKQNRAADRAAADAIYESTQGFLSEQYAEGKQGVAEQERAEIAQLDAGIASLESALAEAKSALATLRADSKTQLAEAKATDAANYKAAVEQARANFDANVEFADDTARQAFETKAAELTEQIEATEQAAADAAAQREALNRENAERSADALIAQFPMMAGQRDSIVAKYFDRFNNNPDDPANSPVEVLNDIMREQSAERAAVEQAREKIGKSGLFAKMRSKGLSWLRRS